MLHFSRNYIMQTKLIQEIKFVGKAMYESIRGIKFTQMFYPPAKTSEKHVSSEVSNLMHKFENALMLYRFFIFLNLESSKVVHTKLHHPMLFKLIEFNSSSKSNLYYRHLTDEVTSN